MTTHTRKMVAAWMALVFSALLFTACADNSASSTSATSSTSSVSSISSSESSSSEDEEASGSAASENETVVIGKVTYIGASSLVVDVYEEDVTITDYTDLSGVTLTATGDSETIALDTGATYEVVVDGVMEETSLDDLLEGEMVAVITDSSGMQEVIVLETVVDNAAEDATDNASSVEDSAESSTLEETAGE